jgi:uracil-DNA glycosylase
VYNQYTNPDILKNLELYLSYLLAYQSEVLAIGEAPGYRGCRLTGIPFTSCAVIRDRKHRIFHTIANEIRLEEVTSETTAKILWDFLNEDMPVPIMWNAFPFHPHQETKPESNRRPNSDEIEEGKIYLRMVHDIYKPSKLCGIGRVGESILKEVFPDKEIVYVRHPSHGGKTDFTQGMKEVLLSERSGA